MTPAVEELKVRARIARNAARSSGAHELPRLGDCLHRAARDAGFLHWEHARRVLGGGARPGDDMGSFWHAPGCSTMLNRWFADEAQARQAHAASGGFLLPYRRQFMVVQGDFIRELGLDPQDPAWTAAGHDLTLAYGSAPWVALSLRRLKAPVESFR